METLDKDQIKNLLPHREPMLLIDELVNIKKLSSATGILYLKKDRNKNENNYIVNKSYKSLSLYYLILIFWN